MAQLAWIPGHLRDIESDMSAFHRVDDIRSMPARKFFPFAWRLPAYEGVMRARAVQEQRGSSPAPVQHGNRGAPRPGPEQRVVPATRAALQADPVLSGLISFGTATGGSGTSQPDGRPDLREVAEREYPELRAERG